jgi:uncharacterized protein YndB with AHSA1/START domain
MEGEFSVPGSERATWRDDNTVLQRGCPHRCGQPTPAPATRFGFTGEFKEVAAPNRLVPTERWDYAPAVIQESLNTMTVTERNGRTRLPPRPESSVNARRVSS